MLKSIISGILAAIIAAGVPVQNVDIDTGRCINKYVENGRKYSTVQTVDGNLWIVEKSLKKGGKYIIAFDNKSTESVYDDEVIYIRGCK